MTKLLRNASLALVGAALFFTTSLAQTAPDSAPSGPEKSQTRTRRAASATETTAKRAPKPTNKLADKESDESARRPGPETEAAKSNKSSVVEEAPAKGETTQDDNTQAAEVDPITALRDQIDAEENAAEKSRLQMKLVELLSASGDGEKALLELRQMSAEDRFDPVGFYNIGNGMARLGDAGGAIATYRKAIDQRKGRYSRALNNLGVVLMRQGRWDEAHEALLKALRLENFRYAEASYNLGRLYSSRGEHDLAAREWRRALAVNPEHSAAAQALAAVRPEGRITVAAAPRRTVKASDRSRPESVATKTARPFKAAKPAGASKGLSVDPETYAFLQRARNASERDRPEEAVTNYRRVITRMGGYFAPANLELSYALINSKKFDEAMIVLLPVAERDGSRYPISYYHLARLYEARGELKLAEENFSRAAALYRQDNSQFLLDVSRVREKLGDYEGALVVFEEYLATAENRNRKLEGSAERLAFLKQRVASAEPK